MPNYCNNTLKVMGDASEMKRFKEIGIVIDEDTKEPVWYMGNYFPTPEPLTRTISPAQSAEGREFTNEWEISSAKKRIENGEVGVVVPVGIPCANNSADARAKLVEEFGFDSWYEWCVANWGTKWNCNTNEDTVLEFSFDSAWSPPIKWLAKVVTDFPTLKFKMHYIEPGCDFCGMVYSAEIKEGEFPYLESEEGEILHTDEEGNPCHYDDEKEGWVNTATGELYLNEDGEIDEDMYPDECSSVANQTVWFEE